MTRISWVDRKNVSGESKQCFVVSYEKPEELSNRSELMLCALADPSPLELKYEKMSKSDLLASAAEIANKLRLVQESKEAARQRQLAEEWNSQLTMTAQERDAEWRRRIDALLAADRKEESEYQQGLGRDVLAVANELRFRLGYDGRLSPQEVSDVSLLLFGSLAGAEPYAAKAATLDMLARKLKESIWSPSDNERWAQAEP